MSASLGQVCRRFLHWLRPAPGRRRRRTIRPSRPPQLEGLEARTLLTGTWSVLSNTHSALGTMLLLTDGTVMAQGAGQSNTWFRLTPSASGSYTAGTWSARASMAQTRLYFGSNVLPDGRLFLVGGEYSSAGGFTNTGEIYNPVSNTWSNIANFPQSVLSAKN